MSGWKKFAGTMMTWLAAVGVARADVSNLKTDETLVFFRTAAWQDEHKPVWHIPIHGWVYEPEDSLFRKAAIARVLRQKYDLQTDAATQTNFDQRVNLLIADNERNKKIVIRLADKNYKLAASRENGHFQDVITLPLATVEKFRDNNRIHFNAVTRSRDHRSFPGEVMLVAPQGISVISDIDDTVKISEVTDRRSLLQNTFYRDFAAVTDMPKLYQSWSEQGKTLHFVSSSPWQLYPPLLAFTEKQGFPWATFSLKKVRFRDSTFFNLFKKGTETKPEQIEPILQRYPKRRFILVGDSGEQDPEVYAGIAKKYPAQIAKIFIRNIGNESSTKERFQQAFSGLQHELWQVFSEPLTLLDAFKD